MANYATFQEWLRENYKGPSSAVDIIIRYNGQSNDADKSVTQEGIVLIERLHDPLGLAFPGGIVDKESFEQAAIRETFEETGLEVVLDTPEHPLCVFSDTHRDPRAHIATHVYVGKGYGILKAGDDAKKVMIYRIEDAINLIGKNRFAFPDHERMLIKYLKSEGHLQ